jgi:hypothetical protein
MNRSRILAACVGAVLLFAWPSIGTAAAPAVPPDPSIRSITDALDTEQIRYRVVGDRQELVQVSYKTDSTGISMAINRSPS